MSNTKKKPKRSTSKRVEAKDIQDAKKKAAFIELIRTTGHVSKAAESCGAGRSTLYAWRKKDAAFRQAWDDAEASATDDLIAEATRRAFAGTVKPVIHQGKIATRINYETGNVEDLYIREYSDTLIMFLLKARDPFRFCDRARTARLERKWAKKDEATRQASEAVGSEFELSLSEREALAKRAKEKAALAESPAA